MNFMKNNPQNKKGRKKTINFFQTVREGRRSFDYDLERIEHKNGIASYQWTRGRRFIQPTRTGARSFRTGTDVRTILSSSDKHCDLRSNATEERLADFFSISSLSESANKKKKTSVDGVLKNSSNSFFLGHSRAEIGSSIKGFVSSDLGSRDHKPSTSSSCRPCSGDSLIVETVWGNGHTDNGNKRALLGLPKLTSDENRSLLGLSPTNNRQHELPHPNLSSRVLRVDNFFEKPRFQEEPQTSDFDHGFFKGLFERNSKLNLRGEFFNSPKLNLQNNNCSVKFFKVPVEPPKRLQSVSKNENISQNKVFFKKPIDSEQASSSAGLLNSIEIQTENLAGSFFKIKSKPKKENLFESLFKSSTTHPQQSNFKDQFLNSSIIKSQEANSNDNIFKNPSIITQKSIYSNGPLNKPASKKNYKSTNSYKTPSYAEFLRPPPNTPSLYKSSSSANPSASDAYESLFTTPSKIKSLPKITTPHLFQPVEKTVSKESASSVSKMTSKITTKTFLDDSLPYFIISITEGRGSAICEVGIAAIDLRHPKLILSQFTDEPTYRKLLSKINLFDAAEVLMPETFSSSNPSEMFMKVTEVFPDTRVTTAKRSRFSAKNGLDSIRRLILRDDSSIEIVVHKKYFALAAAEALLGYIEVKHSILFSPKTLKVIFESAQDVVSIDLETIKRLELVYCCGDVLFPEKYSLFGLLNYTKTMGGKRRLRSCLMQPLSSLEKIKSRLSTVSALVNNQVALSSLQTCLLKFSTVERLLWLCRSTPNFKNEVRTFDTLTNYILLLKTSLESIPHLRKVLEEIDDDQIIDIRNELYENYYDQMLVHIKQMIREDARITKGYASTSKERCFAIKEGVNELLDLARATYSDLVEEVLKMVTTLAEEFTMPLKMTQTADMGFHASFTLPRKASFKRDCIPDLFTDVKTKNKTVHLLTDDMFNLNVRINRALEEIQLITNVVIYDLVESLKEGMSHIYRLCDRISELDLFCSLAQVSSSPDYVIPVFSNHLDIIGARHPILDHINPNKPIPNNIKASKGKNFTIITGPNMSGKTVYSLTIPLVQIMAQAGCYVPADKAELRITDHIFVRKGGTDNIPCRLSSHGLEMKELAYNLKILTKRSLIILDELCSNTTSERGIALAWAFCEQFLKESAFTFLTTHYHYLCNISKVYTNVINLQMETVEKTPTNGEKLWDLTFTYRLLPGITQMTDYALRLMMASALPDEVKQSALSVAEDLKHRRDSNLPICLIDDPETVKEIAKIEKLENFMSNLKVLCKSDKFTPDMVLTIQKMIREEILPDFEIQDENSGESEAELEPNENISPSKEVPGIVVGEAIEDFLRQEQESAINDERSLSIEMNNVEEFVIVGKEIDFVGDNGDEEEFVLEPDDCMVEEILQTGENSINNENITGNQHTVNVVDGGFMEICTYKNVNEGVNTTPLRNQEELTTENVVTYEPSIHIEEECISNLAVSEPSYYNNEGPTGSSSEDSSLSVYEENNEE